MYFFALNPNRKFETLSKLQKTPDNCEKSQKGVENHFSEYEKILKNLF